jgi:polyhydroxyalkanoate synthesis regulator phasin
MADQLTEHQRKVGTFKTTVLTDMSAYHRELVSSIYSAQSKNSSNVENVRKLVEDVASQINLNLETLDHKSSTSKVELSSLVDKRFEQVITHVSATANDIIARSDSESDEIKTFVKHMHESSVNNHAKADTKIEAVFQRVNSGLGVATVKKIPSL